VPLVWILISVQFMELIWVLLNYLGIERTTTESKVTYVGDVHLEFMPYSHSLATMGGAAILAWLVIGRGLGEPDIGAAVGLGIGSHLVLDLITHRRDIALVPALNSPKLGLGLYENLPIPAFILEIGYGMFCWWVYKGSAARSDHRFQPCKHFDVRQIHTGDRAWICGQAPPARHRDPRPDRGHVGPRRTFKLSWATRLMHSNKNEKATHATTSPRCRS